MSLVSRAGRRTNVGLLLLLASAFATGWLAYGVGSLGVSRVVAVGHALAGLGLLVLVPWKAVIVRRAWGHARRTDVGSALAVLVVVCVGAGVVHTWAGWAATRGVALQLHVATAVLAVAVLAWHVARHPQRPRRVDLSRRSALRALGLVGGATVTYSGSHGAAAAWELPRADRRATGSSEVGTGDPTLMPVTQWFTDTAAPVAVADYRLRLSWSGGTRRWTYAELTTVATDEVEAVLDCTGGWYASQTWRGVRLDRLLPPDVEGRSILVTSATGYRRRLPLRDAPALLLATHVAGVPLSTGHGAPVRLVAPGRRGFWWVKWVDTLAVENTPWWWQPPLPLQ